VKTSESACDDSTYQCAVWVATQYTALPFLCFVVVMPHSIPLHSSSLYDAFGDPFIIPAPWRLVVPIPPYHRCYDTSTPHPGDALWKNIQYSVRTIAPWRGGSYHRSGELS